MTTVVEFSLVAPDGSARADRPSPPSRRLRTSATFVLLVAVAAVPPSSPPDHVRIEVGAPSCRCTDTGPRYDVHTFETVRPGPQRMGSP